MKYVVVIDTSVLVIFHRMFVASCVLFLVPRILLGTFGVFVVTRSIFSIGRCVVVAPSMPVIVCSARFVTPSTLDISHGVVVFGTCFTIIV